MKVERNILNKKNLAELENLVNRLDVAVDHSMKDYFELVEKYLVHLCKVVKQEHYLDRDLCVECATDFNNCMNSELGKIRIGKFHGYQEWVGIYVVKDNATAIFWADWEVMPGKIEIALDRDNFKVLPNTDLNQKLCALHESF